MEESYFADEIESSDLLVSMVLADDKNGAYSMIIQPYQSRRVSEKEHSVVYEQNFGTDRFLFLKKVRLQHLGASRPDGYFESYEHA